MELIKHDVFSRLVATLSKVPSPIRGGGLANDWISNCTHHKVQDEVTYPC